jgi:hypothetical protein
MDQPTREATQERVSEHLRKGSAESEFSLPGALMNFRALLTFSQVRGRAGWPLGPTQ